MDYLFPYSNPLFHKKKKNILELPEDVLLYLTGNFLDIEDLLILRTVSKGFHFLLRSYVEELNFIDKDFELKTWYTKSKTTKLGRQLDVSKLPLLFNIEFENIKYLKFKLRKNHFNLELLNRFHKLRYLGIDDLVVHSNTHLQFPKLELFDFTLYDLCTYKFKLSTPSLKILSIYNCTNRSFANQIEFVYPETVKVLKLQTFDPGAVILKEIEILELISLNSQLNFQNRLNWKTEPQITEDQLLKFEKLKQIRCQGTVNDFDLQRIYRAFNGKIKFFLDGVGIDSVEMIEEYSKLNKDLFRFKFHINNYNRLNNGIQFINELNESEFEYIINSINKLPIESNLLLKFTNIRKITIGKFSQNGLYKDEQPYINFIRKCQMLHILIIQTDLSQHFFDLLPDISLLTDLTIKSGLKPLSNYRFITGFSYLTNLIIYQDFLDDDELDLKKLRYLNLFRYKVKDEVFSAEKTADGYIVNCYLLTTKDLKYKNLEQLSQSMRNFRIDHNFEKNLYRL